MTSEKGLAARYQSLASENCMVYFFLFLLTFRTRRWGWGELGWGRDKGLAESLLPLLDQTPMVLKVLFATQICTCKCVAKPA